MIGEQVGAYTIVAELGRGAVGVVYLAQHRHLDRKVAIKFLQGGFSDRVDLLDRFFAEARAASMIDHEGIVRVLDCDVHSTGNAYIVMEHLEGESLRRHLASRGRLPVPEAAAIMLKVAEAIAAAHAKGIVHRDLKPDNIFLLGKPAGAVKIVDFGIAKLCRSDSGPSRTLAGLVLGTPLYMSPEQARGASTLDVRSDVYSLGCILFELLCGRTPFVSRDTDHLLAAHLHEPPPAAQSLAPAVPGNLSLLVDKMLAKSPLDRPALGGEVIPTLRSLIAGHATVVGSDSGAPSPPASAAPPAPRALTGILAVLGVLAVGAGGLLLYSRRTPAPRPAVNAPVSPQATTISPSADALAAAPAAPPPLAPSQAPTTRRAPAGVGRRARLTLSSDPPGAMICLPGNPTHLGLTNTTIALADRPPVTLLLFRRGYHVATVTVANDLDATRTVRLRPLADDDLQPPPPCR
jgi:predicted Ser/Thr protein kinase